MTVPVCQKLSPLSHLAQQIFKRFTLKAAENMSVCAGVGDNQPRALGIQRPEALSLPTALLEIRNLLCPVLPFREGRIAFRMIGEREYKIR